MTDSPTSLLIYEQIKDAMRQRAQARLATLRLIWSGIKQAEIDNRASPDEKQTINILHKMAKQRKEAILQYQQIGRADRQQQEQFELEIIQSFLPQQLSNKEVIGMVEEAIKQSNAESIRDMKKVMQLLKQQVQGRYDMQELSNLVKQKL